MRKSHLRRSRPRGFTLVELMVVVAIIGVLVALILPAIQAVRDRAAITKCRNHLHNLGIALHEYHEASGSFPCSVLRQEDGKPPPPPNAKYGLIRYRGHFTGFHLLLPFIEQRNLYEQYDFNGTWLSSMTDAGDRRHWSLNNRIIPLLLCPGSPRPTPHVGSTDDALLDEGEVFVDQEGDSTTRGHWMASTVTDYSFSHGADINRDVPGLGSHCKVRPKYWQDQPKATRGPFGYNSSCKFKNIVDGKSYTFLMGEKVGSMLQYAGWNSTFPRMRVEYPWAMAAVLYFGPTGDGDDPGSAWVAGPYAATHDLKLPACADAPPGSGEPFPMNPFPRNVPFTSDERPFYSFQSPHGESVHFVFADGSVRALKSNMNQRVYEALSTIEGKEHIAEAP